MDAEERIEELAEQAFRKQKGAASGGDIITAIADAIRAAVAEEREACADAADAMNHPEYNGGPGKVAAAIRARGD